MVELGEPNGYFFDFMGPVVDVGLYGPYESLVKPREDSDYKQGNNYLLPPNFLRNLISREALQNLRGAFSDIQQRFPNRFSYFDIHMRGLYQENYSNRELYTPWDILTYVVFDGYQIYSPVNVSFSHT